MGHAASKDPIDNRTGMTKHENKLVQDSWRRFCERNPDFGLALFMNMFSNHPEYLALFPSFKDVHMRDLPDNAMFRAHTREVGHHLTAFIESLDETDVLIEMVRKNAVNHLNHPGVHPHNFESFFSATMEEMMATNRSAMTSATVSAWEKLFETMNMITRSIYNGARKTPPTAKKGTHDQGRPSIQEPTASGASPKARGSVSSPKAGKRESVSPLAIQGVIKGVHSKRKSFFRPAAHGKGSASPTSTKGASKP